MPAKYDEIGINYNLTRKADPYLLGRFLDLLQVDPQKQYLDIGCGTGNYTIALHHKGAQFIGVDPSIEMLDKAKLKCPDIKWIEGSAEYLELTDHAVDSIMASLTIHHWTDLGNGFKELFRILKPGGRFILFTSTPIQMEGYWLNHYFPKMLKDSISQMPSLKLVEAQLTQSGFENVQTEKYFIQPDLQDLFLYAGKHDPSLYFKPRVRRGISSFSALANQEEVEQGLSILSKDIQSGKIKQIIQSYDNDLGDYLFVIAEKRK